MTGRLAVQATARPFALDRVAEASANLDVFGYALHAMREYLAGDRLREVDTALAPPHALFSTPDNKWAGTGKLIGFLAMYLPEFLVEDRESDRVVRSDRGFFHRILGR